MKRVLCNATVERNHIDIKVNVTGTGDHAGKVAEYRVPLFKTDDDAAMESIRKFVSEHGGDQ